MTLQTTQPRDALSANRGLWIILAVALVLRVVLWFALPNVAHNDENFQFFEQAGRIVFGRGLVPLEYQIGARSWLVPGLVAPIMALGAAISHRPDFVVGFVHTMMMLFSLLIVVAAYRIGSRFGRNAALWAAGLNAIWVENLYFAPHLVPDSLSAIPLIVAISIALSPKPDRFGKWFLAGVVFGLAFVFRVQISFGIATAIFWVCGLQFRRRYWPLSLGFAVPLLALGITDWVTWGAPFKSVYIYVLANSSGLSQAYGTDPIWYYVLFEAKDWLLAIPLLFLTIFLGAKRQPLLFVVALVLLVTFSLIGHKEYRFYYPAIPLLITLAGIGTAELLNADFLRRGGRLISWATALPARTRSLGMAVIWFGLSVQVGLSFDMRQLFQREIGTLTAYHIANIDPEACGVGIDGYNWFRTGLFRLRQDMTLFGVTPEALPKEKAAFNYIFAFRNPDARATYEPQGYRQVSCSSGNIVCVFKRPGTCDAALGSPLRPVTDSKAKAALQSLGFNVE